MWISGNRITEWGTDAHTESWGTAVAGEQAVPQGRDEENESECMKGYPLPLSPKHWPPDYGRGFVERTRRWESINDMCWFQDGDIDVIKKWPYWLTGMHGIMNKYILRPSSQELFQRQHFFSFPNQGWCKGVEYSLMYGELHSGTTMHHRGNYFSNQIWLQGLPLPPESGPG